MSDSDKIVPIDRARKGRGRKMTVKPLVEKAMADKDPQAVLDNLTVRQRTFAYEYIKDFNATEAARRAGYTGNNLNKIGYQQLTHPGVRTSIDFLLKNRSEKADVDVNYVINKWVRMIEKCEADESFNASAVLRATELLAKHLGMFIERTEISGKDGEAIKIEKVQEDADAFTRAIAGIASRQGEATASKPTNH